MKKLTGILFIALAMLIASCEGPMGPMGPPGLDGGLEYASIYEIEGDFTSDNDYRLGFTFPGNGIYDSDVVLVYILWETAEGMDVWRLLPQTVVLQGDGVIQYNFDYTYVDVQVFMEFTIPENELLASETDDQVFRIAVVPADFAASKSVDVSDINTILQHPRVELKMMDRIELETVSKIE